jgi:REP-associated tyrosine transposase
MARIPRLELSDGFAHVTCRGNRRDLMYAADPDPLRYLALAEEALGRFDVALHAFCLMPNHVHLVIEAEREQLSKAMHRLNGAYARWFNRRYGYVGHLLQERFHAVAIESDRHLAGAVRYTLLNPVRARLCRRPADWRWSSYRATVGDDRCPPFLTIATVLEQFSINRSRAKSAFRAFVNDGLASLDPSSPVPVTVTGTGLDQPWPYAPGKRSASVRISSAAGRPTTFR